MAIKAKINTIQGVDLSESYINFHFPQIIKRADGDKNIYDATANAAVYASEGAYNAGRSPIEGFSVVAENIDIDKNPLTQIYAELKKNPRLSEIKDC